MPVVTNPLLQATSVSKAQASTSSTLAKASQVSKDTSSQFSQVYAKQATAAPAKVAKATDSGLKAGDDKPSVAAKSKAGDDKNSAASKPAVADSGKSLPAHSATKADKANAKADDDSKDDKDPAAVNAVTDASDAPAPVLDPQPVVAQADPAATPPVDPALVQPDPALTAATTPAAQPAAQPAAETFDPATDDALAGLPVIRMALEQNAKAQGTTSAHASTETGNGSQKTGNNQNNLTADQSFASGLAAIVDQQQPAGTDGEPDGKAFTGQIEAGLKDIKSADSDTRIDDFANRLSALTQAATPKTANAVAVPTQPLAMTQAGWSEGLVNRVMYMSSQNLKSADIQLTPAELGRLDIRVNMATDQATQITFTSAHVGVREALESQQGKLRDMFAEQGMGQLDVNVSDQSRNSQNQQQTQQGQSTSGSRFSLDGSDDNTLTPVAQAANVQQVMIGTSAIDYYA
ncbi:flagellar hook-length control protein FliK [Pseudomonas abieticivorans]|uniref:flagellar hook-length control protein FliK n=1 Tax=Pseudomonas abieticivorans TaxID=2931382 RepID=UPI0020C14FE8|nr:flagellar hook-length control protein FliK [Pseudomonas sp. PIA16]